MGKPNNLGKSGRAASRPPVETQKWAPRALKLKRRTGRPARPLVEAQKGAPRVLVKNEKMGSLRPRVETQKRPGAHVENCKAGAPCPRFEAQKLPPRVPVLKCKNIFLILLEKV